MDNPISAVLRVSTLGGIAEFGCRTVPLLFELEVRRPRGGNACLIRGELEQARAQGEYLLSLAQRGQDSVLLLQAHVALGGPLMFLGSLGLAYECLARGSRRMTPPAITPRSPSLGWTLAWLVAAMPRSPSSAWANSTKPGTGARRRWLWPITLSIRIPSPMP
jgi:hypothetical protein